MYNKTHLAKARRLRAGGMSLKEVARRLGIAKSTASYWLRDMPLDPEELLRRKSESAKNNPHLREWRRNDSLNNLAKWQSEADSLIVTYCKDPLFSLGLGLYWGEGSKTGKRLVLSNSDPNAIRMWERWCRRYIPSVPQELRLIVRADVDAEAARQYWSNITSYPVAQHVAVTPTNGKATVKAFNGTAHVRACKGSAEAFIKVMRWISKIQLL